MSTWRIYMSGSTRVHKCSRRPCMPEYGSESWTLHLYVCTCICEACERYLSMGLSVMKIVGVNFVVVWIFCSFNDVFITSYTFKMFWKLIGLLSNYHNNFKTESTTFMTALKPCASGNSTMKSMLSVSQCVLGTWKGWSWPIGGFLWTFVHRHRSYVFVYLPM